jgi:hypothetical protein
MFSRSANDNSRVVRMMIAGDGTILSVILTTVELSFTIVICL